MITWNSDQDRVRNATELLANASKRHRKARVSHRIGIGFAWLCGVLAAANLVLVFMPGRTTIGVVTSILAALTTAGIVVLYRQLTLPQMRSTRAIYAEAERDCRGDLDAVLDSAGEGR